MQFALTFGSNEFTKFLHVNRRNDPVLSFFFVLDFLPN